MSTHLGFEDPTGGDSVFRSLVLARLIEPTSKLDSICVLEEAGLPPSSSEGRSLARCESTGSPEDSGQIP